MSSLNGVIGHQRQFTHRSNRIVNDYHFVTLSSSKCLIKAMIIARTDLSISLGYFIIISLQFVRHHAVRSRAHTHRHPSTLTHRFYIPFFAQRDNNNSNHFIIKLKVKPVNVVHDSATLFAHLIASPCLHTPFTHIRHTHGNMPNFLIPKLGFSHIAVYASTAQSTHTSLSLSARRV